MPFSIPPFQQFQAPMFPLRGLWNRRPPEGDRFVSAEIDWLTPGINNCVQFQLSGNSPVPLSQIAALYVDNARCGSDITFLFGDSGFILVVPAYAQGLYPVLSNALMFYCSAPQAVAGDVSVVQILNSIPPPIPVQLGQQQLSASVSGIPLQTNATTPLVASTVSGTLNAFTVSLSGTATAAGAGTVSVSIWDSQRQLWSYTISVLQSQAFSQSIPVSGLRLRFTGGLSMVVFGSTNIAGGFAVVNLYYAVP